MKPLPTAQAFRRKQWQSEVYRNMSRQDFDNTMMIAFAKLHVEAALEAAADKLDGEVCDVDPNSILSSYPLDLIK